MVCLQCAAATGDLKHVQRLLSDGVCIDSVGECHEATALFVSITKGYPEIALYLLSQGAKTESRGGACFQIPLLHAAVAKGLVHVVEQLVEKRGISVLSKDQFGFTPLQVACSEKNVNVVRYLLRKTAASIHDRSKNGNTVLHFAVTSATTRGVSTPIIGELISQGADLNAKDQRGWSPLHSFVNRSHGQSEVTRTTVLHIMLGNGADRKQSDLNGYTPLHLVKNACDARLLVEFDYQSFCILDVPGKLRFDPIDIQKLFDARNCRGKTALETAQQKLLDFRQGPRRESLKATCDYLESWTSLRLTSPVESLSGRAHFDQGVLVNRGLDEFQEYLARRLLRIINRSLLSEVSEVILGYLSPLDLVNAWWEDGIQGNEKEAR